MLADAAPRFLTRDIVGASAAVYSNFRKTDVAYGGEKARTPLSEYQAHFQGEQIDVAKQRMM